MVSLDIAHGLQINNVGAPSSLHIDSNGIMYNGTSYTFGDDGGTFATTEWVEGQKYETADDVSAKLAEAKKYTDDEIFNLNVTLGERIQDVESFSHNHDNDGVLAGITEDKVSAWDAAEQNAKDYADGKITEAKTEINTEVAKKANSADVYAKTETYSKTEVDALFTWGEF